MDGIRQKKHAAMGDKVEGQSGNFGVESFASVNGGKQTMPDPGGDRREYGQQAKMLHDHERGVGKPISRGAGMMAAQRHPDHGLHHHQGDGDFGVASMKSVNG